MSKHEVLKHKNVVTTIDPSILDLRWGKTKEIKEIQARVKVEAEVLDLKSLTEPLVKMQNLGSVEEIEPQVKVVDKGTEAIANSSNQMAMAIETVKLEMGKLQGHSLVGEGNYALWVQEDLSFLEEGQQEALRG